MIRLLSFIIGLFTWGSVQLVTVDYTKDIYSPIAELNNHSLSEVFDGGNIVPNYDMETTLGWIAYGGTQTSLNGIITINTNSTQEIVQHYRTIDYTVSINTKLYARNRIKTNTNIPYFSLRLENVVTDYSQQTIITNPIINKWYEISNIYTATVNAKPLVNSNFNIGGLSSGLLFDVDYYYLIDLTTLGIDNLTNEQMDDYYEQYIENKNNSPHERYEVTVNDLDIADLVILMSFSLGYIIIFLVIRKVVKKK